MHQRQSTSVLRASFAALCLVGCMAAPLQAQAPKAVFGTPTAAPPLTMRLTLEEAKERALTNNKLLGHQGRTSRLLPQDQR
jgi:hypothetical protein